MGKTSLARARRARETELLGLAVLVAFFVSGMAGLLHEVVWTRLLRLVMGNTTYALTTVLCVFMGGLALGSYWAGRWVERRSDPLRIFALLEASVGLYCLVLPFLIEATQPLYRVLFQSTQASILILTLTRFFLCALLLLLPATFMGATLPVLIRFFTSRKMHVGLSVGRLYAINTFGAVVGAGMAGFLLIPSLGVHRTILVAGALNFLCSALALNLYRRSLARASQAAGPVQAGVPQRGERGTRRLAPHRRRSGSDQKLGDAAAIDYGPGARLALVLGYAFSGAAALVYEIAWTRVLSLMFGSSVYALSLMLTAFILGLALGSALCARLVDRWRDPLRVLAFVQLAIALSALSVVPLFGRLPFIVTGMLARFGDSFWSLQVVQFVLVFVVMLVPTTLMGAAFPLASRVFTGTSEQASRSVGTVYAGNTLGAILGSFLGGFVLIPWLGTQHSLFVAVWVNTLVGVTFLVQNRSVSGLRRFLPAGIAVGVVTVGCATISPWDAARMSFGPFAKARRMDSSIARSAVALQREVDKSRVLFHKEGVATTVTVKEHPGGERSLYVNGKPDASSYGNDLMTEVMLAQVPLLLHPNPHSVLVIGLASGITLGSAALYPVDSLDCAEISPAMLEACRYFDASNYNVLDDPRTRVLVTDGRNQLAMTQRRYDVIISEPSNPWIAGVADLFTREFFELCFERLHPDGITCIWLESYNIDEASFRSVVYTFQSVFPEVSIWNPASGDFLMIGMKSPLKVDVSRLEERLAASGIRADLERIGIAGAPAFLSHIVMTTDAVRRFADGGRLHTDDNALLEFATPKVLIRNTGEEDLWRSMEEHRHVDFSFLQAPSGDAEALAALRQEAARFNQARGHVTMARLLLGQGRPMEARGELAQAAQLNPEDSWLQDSIYLEVQQANALAGRGRFREAIDGLWEILDLEPNSATALSNLAFLLATCPAEEHRDPDEAVRLAERLVTVTQESTASLSTLSIAYAAAGRLEEAEQLATRALEQARRQGENGMIPELQRRLQQLTQQSAGSASAPQ